MPLAGETLTIRYIKLPFLGSELTVFLVKLSVEIIFTLSGLVCPRIMPVQVLVKLKYY